MDNLENKTQNNYESVGGWLLLLCISLTIISPLRTIYQTVINHMLISLYIDDLDKNIRIFYYLNTFLELIVVSLGVRAGIALWQIKQGALKIAKTFFLIFLSFVIISFAVPYIFDSSYSDYFKDVKGTVGNLLYFLIWYTYLRISVRVMKTYK